jgi:preprotein translocase subunit SecE
VEEVLQSLQQAHAAQGNEVSWGIYVSVAVVLLAAIALIVWRERVKEQSAGFAGFMREVVSEGKKITWPSRDELRKWTLAILVFVVIVALVIGTMDIVLQWLLVQLPASI